MNDLISRAESIDAPEKFIKDCNPNHFVGHQKFIEYMDNAEIGSFGKWQFANGFNMGLTAAEVAIKKLPTIDAEPVRHGKWVPKYIRIGGQDWASGMKCSECGEDALNAEGNEFLTDYCPNCGARMDEG